MCSDKSRISTSTRPTEMMGSAKSYVTLTICLSPLALLSVAQIDSKIEEELEGKAEENLNTRT